MQFEWDPEKARTTVHKHGVSFEEASSVFLDGLSLTGDDPDHSLDEERFVIFGLSSAGQLLVVGYTERAERTRIINARQQLGQKGNCMKKDDTNPDELRPEYRRENFGSMVRGKYAQRMQKATNVVVLDPDIADAFPNAQVVNQTLRRLLELANASVHAAHPKA